MSSETPNLERATSTAAEAPAAPHFDAVVFDCDGVLVNSEELAMRVSQRIVRDLGWRADLSEMMQMFVGCSREYYVAEIERRLGRSLETDWMAPYRGWHDDAFRAELQPVPGIAKALDEIELPTAVASNSNHDRIRLTLGIVDLLDRFDGRIASAQDVAAPKPAPDVYLHGAELLGVPASRCIAVDDSRFGVTAAVRAGMHVLAYTGSPHGAPIPEGERIHPFDDMADLPALVERLVRTGSPTPASRL